MNVKFLTNIPTIVDLLIILEYNIRILIIGGIYL